MSARVIVAGSGAICAAGKSPEEIWQAVWTGRSAIRPIQQWDASGWPTSLAGEIPGSEPRALAWISHEVASSVGAAPSPCPSPAVGRGDQEGCPSPSMGEGAGEGVSGFRE